jgi:hypothetical protein
MKLKIAALALSFALAAPVAFAQNTSSTNTNDANANYLSGPDVQGFYTDPNMKTLKSEEEMKTVYGAMNTEQQARLKKACAENEDTRYTGFCTSVGSM